MDLLAFKGVVPEYPQVPTKETPFDASFFANTNDGNNGYLAASDMICEVSQTENISSLYVRHNTGKVGSCCVLALYGAKFVLKCMWSYVPARLCSLTRPVSLYKELFSRFGSSWAGQLVVDLYPERSKIREAALS